MTDLAEPPGGCSWARYVELLAAAHGGLSALTDMLSHRARGVADLPDDPQTIERGLRRLAARGHAPAGKYGRWLLRFFGVPEPLTQTARWMGQYHSRFADLPRSVCEAQLRLWDRPPMCESSAAAWIHLGLASVAIRHRDPPAASARLARAASLSTQAGPEAQAESDLFAARLASDGGDDEAASRALSSAEGHIARVSEPDARACYEARLADQRAYRLLHPGEGEPRFGAARKLYTSIPDRSAVPFVRFRRAHGLAYCAWKLGDVEVAASMAREAAEHAGDGGLIRFRIMALRLVAHVEGDRGGLLRERAARMAELLEHEDLFG